MRYDKIVKVKIIIIKKDIQPIARALSKQNSSLSSYISIGTIHLLDKPVAQIVFRVYI